MLILAEQFLGYWLRFDPGNMTHTLPILFYFENGSSFHFLYLTLCLPRSVLCGLALFNSSLGVCVLRGEQRRATSGILLKSLLLFVSLSAAHGSCALQYLGCEERIKN